MSDVLLVAATERELCGQNGLVCGIGPVDAAAAVAAALSDERPRAVLHAGIAGARRGSGLPVGAIVVGSEAVYEDRPATLRLGTRSVVADPALVALAAACVGAGPITIGTSARVGGTSECAVEAMEGFAVLRACQLADVPAVEVRAISNYVEDARGDWRIEAALEALAAVVPALLEVLAAFPQR